MTEMTREERALYDARADLEAWQHAAELLEPWLKITKLFGSRELTRVMEKAMTEVEREADRAFEALEVLQEGKAEACE